MARDPASHHRTPNEGVHENESRMDANHEVAKRHAKQAHGVE